MEVPLLLSWICPLPDVCELALLRCCRSCCWARELENWGKEGEREKIIGILEILHSCSYQRALTSSALTLSLPRIIRANHNGPDNAFFDIPTPRRRIDKFIKSSCSSSFNRYRCLHNKKDNEIICLCGRDLCRCYRARPRGRNSSRFLHISASDGESNHDVAHQAQCWFWSPLFGWLARCLLLPARFRDWEEQVV